MSSTTAPAAQATTDKAFSELLSLYNLAKRHLGTSGGNTAARVLLSLYNGQRFPIDLTELRRLDDANLDAALAVIEMDARFCRAEVHDLINRALGLNSVGHEFELWAYDLRLPKRCKAAAVPELEQLVKRDQGGAA